MAAHEFRQLPASLLLEIAQGDTIGLVITVSEGEPATPISWTGLTVTAEVLSSTGARRAVLGAVPGPGGTLTVTLSADASADLPVGTHVWRVRLVGATTLRTLVHAPLIVSGHG